MLAEATSAAEAAGAAGFADVRLDEARFDGGVLVLVGAVRA
jgi:hypothetical protein